MAMSGPSTVKPAITWEKLPDHYPLPDDPVDNLAQPILAATLREILEISGLIQPTMLIATNFGICATVEGKTVVKAPDWVYVPNVMPTSKNRRSYTPHTEGAVPQVVMEFLSETEGGEYSIDPNYPYGKWYFYEQILQVPTYVIFEPETGRLEVYHWNELGYRQQTADANNHYTLEGMQVCLGVWQGTKANRTGYWLRWWTPAGKMLPWGTEQVEQERLRAEQERLRAEQAEQVLEQERQQQQQLLQKLRALPPDQLRSLGIEL
jgi:hypothetical protein